MDVWLVSYGRQKPQEPELFEWGADVFRDEVDAYRWAEKARRDGWNAAVKETPLMQYPGK